MKIIKSHFRFNRNQRSGILLLILLIHSLLGVYFFIDFPEDAVLDTSSSEMVLLQQKMDSLRTAEIEARKPKLYPFNPNFITDAKAYQLGMSPEAYNRLKAFRDKKQWVNSIADFKRVTQVSDSLLDSISPFFKFPEWVTNSKVSTSKFQRSKASKGFTALPFDQKQDLNLATAIQLQQVSGVGAALGKRIVAYRNKLGGFSSDVQLYSVWGLHEEVVARTLNLFTVKTPKEIKKINVNTASASDIATIPGISFELAKEIWEFRVLRERVDTISELEKIESLTQGKLRLIELYLSID